jgi:hypothetical protein
MVAVPTEPTSRSFSVPLRCIFPCSLPWTTSDPNRTLGPSSCSNNLTRSLAISHSTLCPMIIPSLSQVHMDRLHSPSSGDRPRHRTKWRHHLLERRIHQLGSKYMVGLCCCYYTYRLGIRGGKMESGFAQVRLGRAGKRSAESINKPSVKIARLTKLP